MKILMADELVEAVQSPERLDLQTLHLLISFYGLYQDESIHKTIVHIDGLRHT